MTTDDGGKAAVGEGAGATLGSYPQCDHPLLPAPAFDREAARTMTVREIKEKFPRGYGRCPNCGDDVISYASFEHYIAGDW